jgi:hypothetical protein
MIKRMIKAHPIQNRMARQVNHVPLPPAQGWVHVPSSLRERLDSPTRKQTEGPSNATQPA